MKVKYILIFTVFLLVDQVGFAQIINLQLKMLFLLNQVL